MSIPTRPSVGWGNNFAARMRDYATAISATGEPGAAEAAFKLTTAAAYAETTHRGDPVLLALFTADHGAADEGKWQCAHDTLAGYLAVADIRDPADVLELIAATRFDERLQEIPAAQAQAQQAEQEREQAEQHASKLQFDLDEATSERDNLHAQTLARTAERDQAIERAHELKRENERLERVIDAGQQAGLKLPRRRAKPKEPAKA